MFGGLIIVKFILNTLLIQKLPSDMNTSKFYLQKNGYEARSRQPGQAAHKKRLLMKISLTSVNSNLSTSFQ